MKRLFILIIGLISIGPSAVSQGGDDFSIAEIYSQSAMYTESNNTFDNYIKDNPSRLYDLANAWFIKSYNYLQLGDYNMALAANTQSLGYKKRLHSEDIAENYMREGAIHLLQGNYERALNVLTTATEFPIEDPQTFALIYAYIASAHQELGNYDIALQRLIESLEILEFELGEDHPDYVTGNYDLGRLYAKMGKIDEAEKAFEKTLSLSNSLENPAALKAKTLNALGLLYHDISSNKAFDYYQKSLAQSKKLARRIDLIEASTHLNLARIWIDKFITSEKESEKIKETVGNITYSLAEVSIDKAITKITTTNGEIINHQIFAEALAIEALNTIATEPDDFDLRKESLTDCLQAITHLNRHLNLLSGDAAKFRFIEESHFVYETGIFVAMSIFRETGEIKYAQDAFRISEAAKAIVLRENSSDLETDVKALAIKKEIREAEAQLLFSPGDLSLHAKLSQKRKAFESLPSFQNLTDATALFPKDISAFQKGIANKTALLSYFIGKEAYYLFAFTQDGFDAHQLPLDFNLGSPDKKFKGLVEFGNNNMKSAPGVYTKLQDNKAVFHLDQSAQNYLTSIKKFDKKLFAIHGYDLYIKLIGPVKKMLKGKTSLQVSPHGVLFKIPFEAFLTKRTDPEGKIKFKKLGYLVEDYEISYTYSLHKSKEEGSIEKIQFDKTFIGMAPIFNPEEATNQIQTETAYIFDTTYQSDRNLRSVLNDTKSFAPLLHSKNEVLEIESIFKAKGKATSSFLSSAANEGTFKNEGLKAKYLHLATHSFVHAKNPKLSGVAFAQLRSEQENLKEDGILYAAEILSLSIPSELVVLSSCESSVGPILEGDGPYSLTRAFLEAGAHKVVSSLWKVYDNYSQTLMVNFYKELLNDSTEAKALREAKLKMIKNSKTANPKIWAGFILME
jgi:CHAT domain-containing protein/tetratricopeptide (TPR) repeat protein